MTTVEIFLLIVGVACIIISFVIKENNKAVIHDESAVQLSNTQKEMIENQIHAVISNQLDVINEKTESELEKISNTKIMEMNEYADTVLGEINKNHSETVFLYDMLNEKAKEVKNVVKDVNLSKKDTKKKQIVKKEDIQENPKQSISVDEIENAAAIQMLTGSSVVASNATEVRTISQDSIKMNEKNKKILDLYCSGKVAREIAKELKLGVGEVKLVIDLYTNSKQESGNL